MTEISKRVPGWQEKIPTMIAITTLILAVCATLTGFKAAGYGNKMVLLQNLATDQWSFYQAKSIKETAYKIQRDAVMAAIPEEQRSEALNKQITVFAKEIDRYKQEKDDIEKEARRIEKERDIAQQYNNTLGQALMFLQVGILLSSLASINKTHLYWYAGGGIGAVGVGIFIYAMLLM
ncbi:MAG TPA: DUF4337 domain-containing protein [Patescibacteria group bacterium]|nr:DUF4337 domain-containing protein [Patescibacteria group bacterium]